MRKSSEITQDYNELCAMLGHQLLQFEIAKSQSIAKFQKLNEEMLEVAKVEEEEAARKAAQDQVVQENLVQLVDDVSPSKLEHLVNVGKKLKGVK